MSQLREVSGGGHDGFQACTLQGQRCVHKDLLKTAQMAQVLLCHSPSGDAGQAVCGDSRHRVHDHLRALRILRAQLRPTPQGGLLLPDLVLDALQLSRFLKHMSSQDVCVLATSPDAARPCRMRPSILRPPAHPQGSRAAAKSAHAGGRPAAAPTRSCAPTSGRTVGALTPISAPHTPRSCWTASKLCPGSWRTELQHAAHSWQHAVTARMHSIGRRCRASPAGFVILR